MFSQITKFVKENLIALASIFTLFITIVGTIVIVIECKSITASLLKEEVVYVTTLSRDRLTGDGGGVGVAISPNGGFSPVFTPSGTEHFYPFFPSRDSCIVYYREVETNSWLRESAVTTKGHVLEFLHHRREGVYKDSFFSGKNVYLNSQGLRIVY